jgi:predicted  nucleic acid-binding Zn-ribbon protein
VQWRRLFRVLLEPAKDPLRDSFGISIERVRELRVRLNGQLAELHTRTGNLKDPAFEEQIRELQAEHHRLLQVERKVNGELDTHRARRNLLDARQTAAQAQDRLQDLMAALDDAHARATALAETVWETSGNPLQPAESASRLKKPEWTA